jgi:DNA helicase-2/ATP-dependent DNA helicase PcrA
MAADTPLDFDFFDSSGPDSDALREIVDSFTPSVRPPQSAFSFDSDADQRRFIETDAPIVRLLAPAGSGKTQSIANKVVAASLRGLRIESFLLLTFDNSAASSLRQRIQEALDSRAIGGRAQVYTLNSFGNRLLHGPLRTDERGLALGEKPEHVQREAVRKALHRLGNDRRDLSTLLPRRLALHVYVQFISVLKNNLILADQLHTEATRRDLLKLCRSTRVLEPWLAANADAPDLAATTAQVLNALCGVYVYYERTLRDTGHIDFDDQKLLSYIRMKEESSLRRAATVGFQHVIVDEFQDINILDFELVRLLAENKRLSVVGDDDQAIYGFRGCSPAFIIDFAKLLGLGVEEHVLATNYRCPRNIVRLSTALIRNNVYRIEKNPVSASAVDADVRVWHCANTATEAQIIARQVRRIADSSGGRVRLADVVVLFRMNSQSLPLQLSLILGNLPYHCRREDNILLSDTMQRILDLARLSVELKADAGYISREASRLLCDCYFRYSPEELADSLHEAAVRCHGYLPAARRLEGTGKFTASFTAAIESISGDVPPFQLLKTLGKRFDNLGGLIGTLEDAVDNRVPLAELVDVASRFQGSSADFVRWLGDLVQRAQGGLYHSEPGDAVNLLTYFRSKGRQWHTVFLPGVNQRVIPHARATLEDERRLFYVAVTRATANVCISYVRRTVGDKVDPSQFIGEMGLGLGQERRAR